LLNKPRIFLAYCSGQEAVALLIKAGLQDHFDLVLWQEAPFHGCVLLDVLINEIKSCEYGVALLSCDDHVHKNKTTSYWVPRDNVVIEVGMFLGFFGQERTAIVSVSNIQGENPKFPTDLQGWLYLEVHNPNVSESIRQACEKIKGRFVGNTARVIRSLDPSSKHAAFNVLNMKDLCRQWGDFEGKFWGINPSWKREFENEAWIDMHVARYQNPQFIEAHYVIDIDRGQNRKSMEMVDDYGFRATNKCRDLHGVSRFLKALLKRCPELEPELERKMKIYIHPGAKNELTTFVAESEEHTRGFVFVRRLNEDTVLEASSPVQVARLHEQIKMFTRERDFVRPSQVEAMCKLLIGE
jgi:hypothetical protein